MSDARPDGGSDGARAIVSGAPYVVTAVNGRAPACFDDFVDLDVVSITATFHEHTADIRGVAVRDGGLIVVLEKDRAGTGHDIRTWNVMRDEHAFVAVARSLF